MKDAHIQPFLREDGRYDWKLIAPNGEEICGSLQGFRDERDAKRAAETAIAYMSRRPEVREA